MILMSYKRQLGIIIIFMISGIYTLIMNADTWSGQLKVNGVSLSIVFNLNEDNPTMDSPDQGVKGIPIKLENADDGKVIINIPSVGATYEGFKVSDQIIGTFTQHGAILPLVLRQGENKLNRPQTPTPPYPYAEEEVSFKNGEAVLKGTLTLPAGYDKETPVLLMVTGSGLQNRDEEIFEHRPFAVIADAFARSGIATLRYDDRGIGESTGDVVNCTTEDFKNDALSGINFLRERFNRVGIIGHSEGGTIALMLAAEQQPDFIISLAGMTVSGSETLVWQNRKVLTEAGYPEETVEVYCNLLADAFENKMNGTIPPTTNGLSLPEPLKQNYQAVLSQLQLPYLSYFISLDARQFLDKIYCPVLALNGKNDTQVYFEDNLEALRSGLPDNDKNMIKAEESLNHLFQHSSSGLPSKYKEIEETFAPEVIETMIKWVKCLYP